MSAELTELLMPTSTLWNGISQFAERNDLPRVLCEAALTGRFEGHPDDLAIALCDTWQMPEHPTHGWLEPDDWVALFGHLGYVVNGRRAEQERPIEALTLYRGAHHPKWRRGMSWTDRPGMAQRFADRFRSLGGSPQVYVATVPPAALLARIDGEDSRGEFEYVVNMQGIRTKVLS